MTDPTKTVTIKNMPEPLWRRVSVLAVLRQVRKVDVVAAALTEYLNREEAG